MSWTATFLNIDSYLLYKMTGSITSVSVAIPATWGTVASTTITFLGHIVQKHIRQKRCGDTDRQQNMSSQVKSHIISCSTCSKLIISLGNEKRYDKAATYHWIEFEERQTSNYQVNLKFTVRFILHGQSFIYYTYIQSTLSQNTINFKQ